MFKDELKIKVRVWDRDVHDAHDPVDQMSSVVPVETPGENEASGLAPTTAELVLEKRSR